MLRKPTRDHACWLVLLLGACLVGCGGSKGTVEGTVTLDGKPLAGTNVTFQPTFEGGVAAFGRTDDSGHYVLNMSMNESGAMVGEHIVCISMAPAEDPDNVSPDSGAVATRVRREKIPAKYNENSELKETIKSGPNTIDFQLEGGFRQNRRF